MFGFGLVCLWGFLIICLFQGNTNPPVYAIGTEVLSGNSVFSPAQHKRMIKESLISIFPSVFVAWNRYCHVYLAQPCFQYGPGSVFLPQSHQDRREKTQPFWSSKHFSISRAVATSLALLLSQPREIKDFTGLWSACKTD